MKLAALYCAEDHHYFEASSILSTALLISGSVTCHKSSTLDVIKYIKSLFHPLQLAWHPRKEGSLSFGTDDGKVGIYDVFSNK